MALETIRDVKEIQGFRVARRVAPGPIEINWKMTPVFINQIDNSITFTIQNGPIKEVGVNGCQVDTLIETAKLIIEGLNKNYPCRENACAITKLDEALMWLEKRTKDRMKRGVEGTNAK